METKMSSLALFDDYCRLVNVLTEDNDDEIYKIISAMETWRKKWSSLESDYQNLNEKYKKVSAEKNALESNLMHARNAIAIEMKRRITAEQERDILENQVALIRELLANDHNGLNDVTKERLAFLHSTCNQTGKQDVFQSSCNQTTKLDTFQKLSTINESSGSLDSSADFSYDRTDDNIDDSNNKNKDDRKEKRTSARLSNQEPKRRPSAPPLQDSTPPKRTRVERYDDPSILNDANNQRRMVSDSKLILNKSYSENSTNLFPGEQERFSFKPDVGDTITSMDDENVTTPVVQTKYTPMKKFLSGGSRRHEFCSKTIIKPETCTPCGKKIGFGKSAFKCKDCRAVCHIECRDKVPLPCVPTVFTPNAKGTMGVVADYAPLTFPMIPALIIHCINEIESRGLKDVGIYRVPGSEREVKDLKEKFLRGKGVPNLSRIDDIHSICGCVKDFLRSLKEPLIATSQWHDFVNASESTDINPLYEAISKLPQANSDTLAFVILHLQRVAESPTCKMPASNLAKIFGPTIVGYSSRDPEPAVMYAETRKQALVMERLLSISQSYWKKMIDLENNSSEIPESQTTTDRRLSVGKGKVTHTPLGPRESTRRDKTGRRSMTFASPMVLGSNY